MNNMTPHEYWEEFKARIDKKIISKDDRPIKFGKEKVSFREDFGGGHAFLIFTENPFILVEDADKYERQKFLKFAKDYELNLNKINHAIYMTYNYDTPCSCDSKKDEEVEFSGGL